ncbi:peptidase M36 [Photobacterium aquimaris]|uniref:Peptidase M36 n=1 Tax=Photobacterium aquimaris TaxID=512643 RepID=A0A2T3IHV6_9GAMM|nr:M36 family metallopeptidase [Photobacterium aquimaris]OBU15312.1 peptidase M36 [Photobacterium aquimaris]OBU18299.1 peptidase M36 [Photobacterium aquimaris]PSU27933.1 peptidase M36 [Photobacterium aquimaris]PSV97151.1 peptidase M36 [Photobacterium aquimaris]
MKGLHYWYGILLGVLLSLIGCNDNSAKGDAVTVDFSPKFSAFQVLNNNNQTTAKNVQAPILIAGKLTVTNLDQNTTEDFDWKAYLDVDSFAISSATTLGLAPANYHFVLNLQHNQQAYYGELTTAVTNGNALIDMVITPVLGNIDTQISVNPEMAKLFFNVDAAQLNLLALNNPIVGIAIDNAAEMKFAINPATSRSNLYFNIAFGNYDLGVNFYDDNQHIGKLALPNSALVIDATTTDIQYDIIPLMAIAVFNFDAQGDSTNLTIEIPSNIVDHVNGLNHLRTQLKVINPDSMIVFDNAITLTPATSPNTAYQATIPLNLSFADANSDALYLTLKFFDESNQSVSAFASCTSDNFILAKQDKTLGCQVTFNDSEVDVVTALNAQFVVNVYDANGNPIKGAEVYIDDALTPIGITGEDAFTTDGALVFMASVGAHDIKAQAIGFTAQKAVTAAPLSINNVDLYLSQRQDTTDHLETANYDMRVAATANVNITPTTTQVNAQTTLMQRLPTLNVDYDKKTGVARVIYNHTGYLTEADPTKSTAVVVMEFLNQQRGLLRLSDTDLANVSQQVRQTQATGSQRYYFQQQRYGRDIFNALLQVNVNRDGRILSVNNGFSPAVDQVIVNKAAPVVSVQQAIINGARKVGINLTHQPKIDSEDLSRDDQKTTLTATTASKEPIEATLVYFPVKSDQLRLAWSFILFTHDQRHVYQMLVDAQNGDVLAFFDQVDSDSYEAFPIPVESPNHATPLNSRQVLTNPAASPGSPWQWHDLDASIGAEYTIMRGNNVHAYNDSNNSGSPTGTEPDCGAGLNCLFPLDLTLPPADSSYAATANLFYWNNIIHDITYLYGFDQASGNFQVNQYGGAGLGGDDVRAEAQDGGGYNNANFYTPADGSRPRMQMYLWNLTTPERDGDYDGAIIVHEYAHGISNRLVGGPTNVNCLSNYQRPSEGISDLYAIMLTHPAGMTGADPRGMGTYVLGQPITGAGIRPQQYSTDPAINNYTYESIISGMSVPHGIGSVWAQAGWEVYWALVNEHGFDSDLYNAMGGSGNQRALLYFTEGLKNTICSPSFIDTRDGVIQAAIDNYAGEDVCLVWQAFADFGLGVDATSVSNNSLSVTNGFAIPAACDVTADVWVEDTHYDYTGTAPDTGNEPDANMVGQSMWRSKAIWNRTTVGSTGSHQNPEYGQPNEINVNVKNRGAATAFNTTVEVYWAHAATGLSWPADWTLLGTDTIGSLAVGADTNATVGWTPPSTGHYCLIARLVNPQDPMTNPETSNINYNTRYNNNIAWRNMNVVDLLANLTQQINFIARSIAKDNSPIILQIGTAEQQRFLQQGGQLQINLVNFTGQDEWQTITQLPHVVRDLHAVTTTTNQGQNEGVVKLLFKADPMAITDNIRGIYQLDVMQLDDNNNQANGGIAYEIITRTHLTDSDNDTVPDIQDLDDDNDQQPDTVDNFPLDMSRQ